MRISDWSSDVCSSDLPYGRHRMPVLKSLATRAPGGARLHSRECQGVPMSVSAVNSNSNVAANTPQNSHTVQHGDTLSAIARQNGVSLAALLARSEEHTSELQSLMRISYAVFCLKKKKHTQDISNILTYD